MRKEISKKNKKKQIGHMPYEKDKKKTRKGM